jgi:hypothetical protein
VQFSYLFVICAFKGSLYNIYIDAAAGLERHFLLMFEGPFSHDDGHIHNCYQMNIPITMVFSELLKMKLKST